MQRSHKVSNSAQFFLPFDFLKIIFIGVQLIYNVVLASAVAEQLVVHIHIATLFRFLSHTGHYRVLNRVACAIQQVIISSVV